MVHTGNPDRYTTSQFVYSWMVENPGRSMVLAPFGLSNDTWSLHSPGYSPRSTPYLSIVICTYGRPDSLNDTLTSLTKQTFTNFEVILITEKGSLANLRDKGLRVARGTFVSFIDDDVYCPPTWAQSVIEGFKKKGVVGVTGPTTITDEYRKNRDIFRLGWARRIHDRLFLDGYQDQPSYLSQCGTPSMASNDSTCSYEGQASYLEACNMSVKRKEALSVGGYDHNYIKTSEWCELDLALKLRSTGTLWFSPQAGLFHRPSKSGVYRARLSTRHRWDNFVKFQRRWIKPSRKRMLYWGWVWLYLTLKQTGLI